MAQVLLVQMAVLFKQGSTRQLWVPLKHGGSTSRAPSAKHWHGAEAQ